MNAPPYNVAESPVLNLTDLYVLMTLDGGLRGTDVSYYYFWK
jgi:hypothetical protein